MTGLLLFDNDQPVANAEVSLSIYGVRDLVGAVLTDSQGRFSLTELPEGTFIVGAHRNDSARPPSQ